MGTTELSIFSNIWNEKNQGCAVLDDTMVIINGINMKAIYTLGELLYFYCLYFSLLSSFEEDRSYYLYNNYNCSKSSSIVEMNAVFVIWRQDFWQLQTLGEVLYTEIHRKTPQKNSVQMFLIMKWLMNIKQQPAQNLKIFSTAK